MIDELRDGARRPAFHTGRKVFVHDARQMICEHRFRRSEPLLCGVLRRELHELRGIFPAHAEVREDADRPTLHILTGDGILRDSGEVHLEDFIRALGHDGLLGDVGEIPTNEHIRESIYCQHFLMTNEKCAMLLAYGNTKSPSHDRVIEECGGGVSGVARSWVGAVWSVGSGDEVAPNARVQRT